MQNVSLKELLEAGCHFGHKVERWHPKAATFIYAAKEGVHIIDLAKTKSALESVLAYVGVGKDGESPPFCGHQKTS